MNANKAMPIYPAPKSGHDWVMEATLLWIIAGLVAWWYLRDGSSTPVKVQIQGSKESGAAIYAILRDTAVWALLALTLWQAFWIQPLAQAEIKELKEAVLKQNELTRKIWGLKDADIRADSLSD